MKLNISLVAFPAVILTVLAVIFVETGKAGAGLVGALTGAALGGLCVFYLKARASLGTFTGFAALAILSALLFALVSWSSPACPIPEFSGRCPAYAVGTMTVFGGLSPIALGLTILPFYAIWRIVVFVVNLFKGKRPVASERLGKILRLTGLSKAPKVKTQKKEASDGKSPQVNKKADFEPKLEVNTSNPGDKLAKRPSDSKKDSRQKSAPTAKRPKSNAKVKRVFSNSQE